MKANANVVRTFRPTLGGGGGGAGGLKNGMIKSKRVKDVSR